VRRSWKLLEISLIAVVRRMVFCPRAAHPAKWQPVAMHYHTCGAPWASMPMRGVVQDTSEPRSSDVRIALISTPFVPVPPQRYGGTELIVAHLARELAARGHQVVLYATGDSSLPGVDIRSRLRAAAWPPEAWMELDHAAFAARDLVARPPVDIVHAHI